MWISLFVMLLLPTTGSGILHRVSKVWRQSGCARVASTSAAAAAASTSATATAMPAKMEVAYENFSFEVTAGKDDSCKARLGLLTTPHGTVETPNFVFCATKAAMKSVTPEQLRAESSQFILSNTYHLMLTPGSEVVEKMGGLHKFCGWSGPMLTDSGGYQIFSMGFGSVSNEIKGKRDTVAMGWNQTLINIDEEGATFRSYVDGTLHSLTPERSVEIQRQLGADLIVVLDECTPFNVDKEYTKMSMQRSHRWALRSLAEFVRTNTNKQALYGIIQGGVYPDLRDESAAFVNDHSFFGTAIGGSLGSDKKGMHDIVAYTRSKVRDDRPVHLLGIGGVRDIFHGVRCGIDTFDCVHPTRLGRHGGALVLAHHWDEEQHEEEVVTAMTLAVSKRAKKMALRNLDREEKKSAQGSFPQPKFVNKEEELAKAAHVQTVVEKAVAEAVANEKAAFQKRMSSRTIREHINLCKGPMRNDPRPIDASCGCYTCKTFSRAYLHHLFKAKESIGCTLVTIHNVHFMNRLMRDIRTGIAQGTLDEVEKKYVHPRLVASLEGDEGGDKSTGIGS